MSPGDGCPDTHAGTIEHRALGDLHVLNSRQRPLVGVIGDDEVRVAVIKHTLVIFQRGDLASHVITGQANAANGEKPSLELREANHEVIELLRLNGQAGDNELGLQEIRKQAA